MPLLRYKFLIFKRKNVSENGDTSKSKYERVVFVSFNFVYYKDNWSFVMALKDKGVLVIKNVNIVINIDLSTLIICKNGPCIV